MRKHCKAKFSRADLENLLADAEIAVCPRCGSCVKPDICFFGEPISARVKRSLSADQNKADLLLVIGATPTVGDLFLVLELKQS